MKFFGSAGLPAFKPPQRLNQSQKRAPAAEDEGQVSAKSLEMLAGMINQQSTKLHFLLTVSTCQPVDQTTFPVFRTDQGSQTNNKREIDIH